MKKLMLLVVVVLLVMSVPVVHAQILKVDFNSNQDGGGDSTGESDPGLSTANHNQEGWSSYHANHEVAAEFATADYGGITITPAWPNTTDNRVQQSIDRGSGNDGNWDDAAGDLNLVTDFIGIDTRTGNGGNGNWDGATGTPTYMTVTIGGLSAGGYEWISFHQDTENVHCTFSVEISTDGGANFIQLPDGLMTDSSPGGSPDSATDGSYGVVVGPDAYTLPSTYRTTFSANGTDDVVLRFALYSGAISNEVHNQIWGMNGFELSFSDKANSPDPANGETGVLRDLSDRVVVDNLSWLAPDNPGIDEILSYDLYLDPNETKVANRDATCLIAQPGLANTVTSWDPAADFDWSTTYYWAVDTNYAIDPNVFKSVIDPVWSFRVIGAGPEADAGNNIITALPLLPANIAGTVTDATNDVVAVEWEIVSYPGDPVSAVMQMIDRGGNDGSVDPDLLREWIGSDTRFVGDPFILTLSGLPAGEYTWTSVHHDPENQTGLFDVTVTDSAGSATTTGIDITDRNLADPNDIAIFATTIVSDGSDVTLVFDKQPWDVVPDAFFLMNGFELEGTGDPLMIDFGQPASPVKEGYQAYIASHEVPDTFSPQSFSAFGADVTISVAWGPRALGLINASVTKTNDDLYAPTAELTADTAGTYQVQLTAIDSEGSEDSDIVSISVAEDACQAAQNAPDWVDFNYFDTDQDCDVDLVDFAAFAGQWLDDINLTAQVN